MGCKPSKLKSRSRHSRGSDAKEQGDFCDASDAALIERRDKETIDVIKSDLNNTPELFVLNNVLMCTIFLRNYQEEISEVIQRLQKPEDAFWEPDILMERANRNVTYRPMHGFKKDIAEPIVTRRIYVPMNEFVEVCNLLDDNEDTSTNSSSEYQVKTEESRRQGYVKLQRLNVSPNQDGTSLKDLLSVPSSNTSGSSDTDSISTSTSIGMPQEQEILVKGQTDKGTLDDCFVYRKVKKPDIDMEIENLDHKHLTDDDIYDVVSYLPSKRFMKYFQNKVFEASIAEKLGLDKYEIDQAVVDEHVPGKIFCNVKDDNGNWNPVELLPCLKTSWPSRQTYEFMQRNALGQFDGSDCGRFKWPTDEMLNQMKNMKCTLVPKGYSRKHGGYSEGDLEWEIHFPLAESYLQMCLRPEQIKCYLILLTIYKEYIKPLTKNFGVVSDHFLALIFWQSEKDYDSWPEHRLGIQLLNLINKFSNCLSHRNLKDFFVRKKDILKNMPRKYLEPANEIFHKIKQSPMMFIIRALRNTRYNSGMFYPPLNYKELLDILYKKDWEQNPYLRMVNDNVSVTTTDTKPKFSDAEKQLEWVKEQERRRKFKKRREQEEMNSLKNSKNLTYNNNNNNTEPRRGSRDSIKDDWECEKRFDRQKKIALLNFFINNYIDIARTSYKIGSKKQTLFYLKQAWYLTKILEQENQLMGEEVNELLKTIKFEEQRVINAMQTNVDFYGRLDVLNPNVDHIGSDVIESLDALDDVAVGINDNQDVNGNNYDIYQQVRQTKISLGTLSRSFSRSYSLTESSENVR